MDWTEWNGATEKDLSFFIIAVKWWMKLMKNNWRFLWNWRLFELIEMKPPNATKSLDFWVELLRGERVLCWKEWNSFQWRMKSCAVMGLPAILLPFLPLIYLYLFNWIMNGTNKANEWRTNGEKRSLWLNGFDLWVKWWGSLRPNATAQAINERQLNELANEIGWN